MTERQKELDKLVNQMLSDADTIDYSLDLQKDLFLSSIEMMYLIGIIELKTHKQISVELLAKDCTVRGLLKALEKDDCGEE